MDAISKKHESLISGMTKIYDTLIAMHYLSANDVVRPPHSPQAVSTATFQSLGYEAEVIQLMRLLPALHSDAAWGWQEQGTEIIPRSKAVNYFVDEHDDWAAYLRWGDFAMGEAHKLLPPWMLKLTIGDMYSGQYGTDLVFDTLDQTIVEWSRVGLRSWDESPRRPAGLVLAGIVEKLERLEWVPYFDPEDGDVPRSRMIVENPIVFQNIWPMGIRVPEEPQAAIAFMQQELGQENADRLCRRINRWRALQKLYRDCGWESGEFDGPAFEQKRAQWIQAWNQWRAQELDFMYTMAPQTEQRALQKRDFEQGWDAFLRESAGENHV